MRNADLMLGVLLFGYVVFTTMNNNLPRWLSVMGVK